MSDRNLFDEMDREKTYGTAWKAEPGDQIEGVVESYTEGTSAYGKCPVCNVRTPDGQLAAIWLFGTVIRSKFTELKPQIGERIAVRRETDQTSAEGHEYRVYSVAVDRDAPEAGVPDFEAEDLAPADDRAAFGGFN